MDPQSATNEAILASDNVRLEAEISRRLNLFNEIGRVVLSALDQEEIYKVAVDAIRFSMGLNHVALFLIDYQFSDLVLKAQTGNFLGVIPNHIRKGLNVGYLGKAARTAQIQTVVVSRDNLNETLVGQPVREIYVPVNIAGQPYAILYVACDVAANSRPFELSAFHIVSGLRGC